MLDLAIAPKNLSVDMMYPRFGMLTKCNIVLFLSDHTWFNWGKFFKQRFRTLVLWGSAQDLGNW